MSASPRGGGDGAVCVSVSPGSIRLHCGCLASLWQALVVVSLLMLGEYALGFAAG